MSLCSNRNIRASLDVLILQYFSNQQLNEVSRPIVFLSGENRTIPRYELARGVRCFFGRIEAHQVRNFGNSYTVTCLPKLPFGSTQRKRHFFAIMCEEKPKFKEAVCHFANILRFHLENSFCLLYLISNIAMSTFRYFLF